jgi:diacylglycerol kinase (ATP)
LKLTSRPGEAAELAARAARNGSSDVVVAGGDGTINEAIQGIAGTTARLAIIPRGTANVLARELGLPLDDQQAIAVAVRGKSRKIFLGLAINETTNERRHFVLMAGVGLDASVVRRVQPSLKKRIGKGAFWISGFSHLATWNPSPFTLEIEGARYTGTFAAIGKGPRYGGDLLITPGARIDQPDFEICIIQTTSRLRYLHLLSYAMRNGMPRDNPEVRFIRATTVRAFGDAPVQVDGELLGHLPMRFEIAPHSLEVVVP